MKTTTSVPNDRYIVIRTTEGRDCSDFKRLNKRTKRVHLQGYPYLWVVEEIFKNAPNTKEIRVTPPMHDVVSEKIKELCHKRGVQLTAGHSRSDLQWHVGENRSPHYAEQQAFLLGLTGQQLLLWLELLGFEFLEARITERYYCLKGEAYIPQRQLAPQFGLLKPSGANSVSHYVNAVLYVLNPDFEVSSDSQRHARRIHKKLQVAREEAVAKVFRQRLADQLQQEYNYVLLANFPLKRIGKLKKVLEAQKDGRLQHLRLENQLDWEVLSLRYALSKQDRTGYRTLKQVAHRMGNVTAEAIRQREARAFRFLELHLPPDLR